MNLLQCYEYTVLFQSVHYFLDTFYVSSDSLIGSRHAAQIQIVYNMIYVCHVL